MRALGPRDSPSAMLRLSFCSVMRVGWGWEPRDPCLPGLKRSLCSLDQGLGERRPGGFPLLGRHGGPPPMGVGWGGEAVPVSYPSPWCCCPSGVTEEEERSWSCADGTDSSCSCWDPIDFLNEMCIHLLYALRTSQRLTTIVQRDPSLVTPVSPGPRHRSGLHVKL